MINQNISITIDLYKLLALSYDSGNLMRKLEQSRKLLERLMIERKVNGMIEIKRRLRL